MQDKYQRGVRIIFFTTALILLYSSSLYSYLLFHTVAEIFSICIAFTVFLLSWNSQRYITNNYLILVGTASLFIGFIDLFHTLGFKGMRIFDYDYYANQLWIAARYFESIILLLAFKFVKSEKKVNTYLFFGICTVATTLIMFSIFIWKIFPECYVKGVGLTSFKIYSEYIICLILIAAIVMLNRNRDSFEPVVYRYLFVSMICTIISEVAFTIYIDNYDISNLIGHYFKIFSFYLIYKTIVVKGIQEPFEIIFREMKQQKEKLFEQNRILTNLSTIDGLTGLYNHRYIYDRLEEEVKQCNRNKCNFVVMILDIDHFKNINDTYGHLTGDKILKELSQVLRDNTRQSDLVGRYGGEEFLIMFAETTLDEGLIVAEKIRKTIENHEFVQKIRLTVSIGIGENCGRKISELLESVDSKMYIAKNSGRNRTVYKIEEPV